MKIEGINLADVPVMSSANADDLALIVQQNGLRLQSYQNLTSTYYPISGSLKVPGVTLPLVQIATAQPTDELVLIVENNGLAVKQIGFAAPTMAVGSSIEVEGIALPSVRFSGTIDGDEYVIAVRENKLCLIPIPNSFSAGALPTAGRTMLANLTSSLILDEGTGGPTWSRATKAWGFNELGYLEELASGCAFFGGARLVRNTVRTTSEDFSNAAWFKGDLTVTGTNVVVCSNTVSIQYINQPGGGTSVVAGTRMAYSHRVKRVVGGVDFLQIVPLNTTYGYLQFVNISLVDGSYVATGCSATVTSVSADTFDVTIFPTVTVTGSDVCNVAMINAMSDIRLPSFIGDGVKSFELLRAWSVDVTNYDASYVPEYVSVGVVSSPFFGAGIDGAKYFETDWQRAPLPAASLLGFRREASATNNLLYNRTLDGRFATSSYFTSHKAWIPTTTGSELVTNGTFASDVSGWTAENSVVTWSAGKMRVVTVGSNGWAKQILSLTVGKTYLITASSSVIAGGVTNASIRIHPDTSSASIPVKMQLSVTGTDTYALIFTATSASQLLLAQNSFNSTIEYDDISVKEATMSVSPTATGLDGIANTATTLTATAADAIILQPITLASAARCASAYVKRRTGTGTISFTQDGGSTWTDITSQINSSTWSRVEITSTLANPSVGFKISTSGDAIDVDCVQNEAGAVATNPIVTTTAAVTRSADSLTYQTAGNIDFAVGTVFAKVLSNIAASTRGVVYVGSSYFGTTSGSATTSFRINDGTTNLSKSGLSNISTESRKRVGSWGPAGLSVTGDGLAPATDVFDGSFGNGASISIGENLNGYIGPVAIWNYQMTDAELQAITA